jgi:hypothetical protein
MRAHADQPKGALMAKKETTTVKDIATRVAKAKGIDEVKAGKLVRGRIRANFDLLNTSTNWPAMHKAGKANKDGARYPEMPISTGDALFVALTKGTALKDALAKPRKARTRKAVTPGEVDEHTQLTPAERGEPTTA